jgi:hypothetical protein
VHAEIEANRRLISGQQQARSVTSKELTPWCKNTTACGQQYGYASYDELLDRYHDLQPMGII